jgi:hypothetical protein
MSVLSGGPWASDPVRDAGKDHAGRRALLVPFVLVGLLATLDLSITIWCDRATGFTEINPLVAALLESGSYAGLVLLKFASLAVFFALLWPARRRRVGLAGAWVGVLVYAAVLAQWAQVLWAMRRVLI